LDSPSRGIVRACQTVGGIDRLDEAVVTRRTRVTLRLGFSTSRAPVAPCSAVGRIDGLNWAVVARRAGVALRLGFGASGAPVAPRSAIGRADGLDGTVVACGAGLAVSQTRRALRAPEAASRTVDGGHSDRQIAVLAHRAGQAEGLRGLGLVIAHSAVDWGRRRGGGALGTSRAGSAGLGDWIAVVAQTALRADFGAWVRLVAAGAVGAGQG
jgi:hypothetical protein